MVTLEPAYAQALPELVLGIGPQRLRDLAVKAMAPKVLPTVGLTHVHMERVSVREHAAVLRDRLIRQRSGTFRALCSDCQSTLEVVARFLALLELYREGLIAFEQVQALGELTVRWTGPDDVVVEIEVDEYAGTIEPAPGPVEVAAALAAALEPVSEPGTSEPAAYGTDVEGDET
jgi:segregation and condensation protein A